MSQAISTQPAAAPGVLARIVPPAVLAAIMWVSELIDVTLGGFLDRFGIAPREVDALPGILAAPFLHGDLGHLVANTGTFIVLGIAVALLTRHFWSVTIGVAVLGGLGVWLLGPPGTVHIGASGVIYGYLAFLLVYGFVARRIAAILVAVGVFLTYGGIVWGVLPGDPQISWQGHLFGAVAGVVMAFSLGRRDRVRRRPAI
ncbi:rhomboid family intramembrane serine protease [Naumannella huperziae]